MNIQELRKRLQKAKKKLKEAQTEVRECEKKIKKHNAGMQGKSKIPKGKIKNMSFSQAKKIAKKHLGVEVMAQLIEDGAQLILFHGKRGGHRATYDVERREFWFTYG